MRGGGQRGGSLPEDELDALLHDADDRASIDDDTADTIPEAPAEPITKPGDIWALGDHRLICSDATDPAVIARLMDGAQASLLFTSPPYAQQLTMARRRRRSAIGMR